MSTVLSMHGLSGAGPDGDGDGIVADHQLTATQVSQAEQSDAQREGAHRLSGADALDALFNVNGSSAVWSQIDDAGDRDELGLFTPFSATSAGMEH